LSVTEPEFVIIDGSLFVRVSKSLPDLDDQVVTMVSA
jgi:hypothetical protein